MRWTNQQRSSQSSQKQVLQDIHAAVKRQEIKINQLQDSQSDNQNIITDQIALSMDKIVLKLPEMVDKMLDKKMGQLALQCNEKLDGMREEMPKNKLEFAKEIEKVRKANEEAIKKAIGGSSGIRGGDATKKIGDLEKKILLSL